MEMLHAHVDALDLFMKFTGLTSAGSGSFTSKIRWYLQCIRFVPGHLDLKEGYLRQCMEGITDLLERHKGPYFLGDIFSIVDVVYAPLIERMVALSRRLVPDGKYNIYENVEWELIREWQTKMLTRRTYLRIAQDQETVIRVFRLQAAFALGTAWITNFTKDLIPNSCEDIQPFLTHPNARQFRKEAEERIFINRKGICLFALRGAPNNLKPCQLEELLSLLDTTLRHVAVTLSRPSLTETKATPREFTNTDPELLEALTYSLDFLTRRVSVPRDMSIGAAAHFRNALKCVRDAVEGVIIYGS